MMGCTVDLQFDWITFNLASKSAANVYGAMHLNPYLGDKLEVRYTVSDTSPCEVGEFSLMKF